MNPLVFTVLDVIREMTDDDLSLLVSALAEGAWDEWDCSIGTLIDEYGAAELRVAARTAIAVLPAIA